MLLQVYWCSGAVAELVLLVLKICVYEHTLEEIQENRDTRFERRRETLVAI